MIIDCDACAVRDLECGDCVVSVLLGMPPVRDAATGGTDAAGDRTELLDPVELDQREQAAIAVLAEHGLVPPLRLVSGSPRPNRPDESEDRARRRAAG